MKLTVLIIVVQLSALCSALTRDETECFGTTGIAEANTGIIGYVTVTSNRDSWRFESNGIPDHDTGNVSGLNRKSIVAGENVYYLPMDPVTADIPSCIPEGPIAMAVNGVLMYNPWGANGDNAVEGDGAEIFDRCDGHTDNRGRYHYHKMPSSCLFDIVEGEASPLIGVAFDGFAIYGPNDENGNRLTSDNLDECHGRYNSDGVYQYHTTADFPYIMGCYKGTPVKAPPPGSNCFFASDADGSGIIVAKGRVFAAPGTADHPAEADHIEGDETRLNDRPYEHSDPRPDFHRPRSGFQHRHAFRRRHQPKDIPGGFPKESDRGRGRRQRNVDSTHYEAGQPMLPANLFRRRLPNGYKKWLSDVVFHRI